MFANLKSQLAAISMTTALALFSLGAIVAFTDPLSAGAATHVFFYLSLFLLLLGLFCLIGLLVRKFFSREAPALRLTDSFRQAALIAALVTGSLLLQSRGLLFWWVEAALILFVTSLEAFLNLKN